MKMEPRGSPETSVINQPTLRNIPADDRIQVNCSDSLRSRRMLQLTRMWVTVNIGLLANACCSTDSIRVTQSVAEYGGAIYRSSQACLISFQSRNLTDMRQAYLYNLSCKFHGMETYLEGTCLI